MWSMVAVGGEDFKMSSPDRTSEDDIEAKTKHTRHALVLLSCQVVDRSIDKKVFDFIYRTIPSSAVCYLGQEWTEHTNPKS